MIAVHNHFPSQLRSMALIAIWTRTHRIALWLYMCSVYYFNIYQSRLGGCSVVLHFPLLYNCGVVTLSQSVFSFHYGGRLLIFLRAASNLLGPASATIHFKGLVCSLHKFRWRYGLPFFTSNFSRL